MKLPRPKGEFMLGGMMGNDTGGNDDASCVGIIGGYFGE